MSRRNNKTSGATTTTKGPPPSHPAEQYVEHRRFLIRSLERNDADLAALVDLNRSLHKVKKAIIHNCGELTLLDLGQGKIELTPDAEDLQGEIAEVVDKELCIDFLLRMKLRRKLLNRLARRLNRVAHAMDGEDVTPPGPPKYGDLRLHVDPEAVQAYTEHWQRQEAARKRIEEEREKYVYKEKEDVDMNHSEKGTEEEGKPADVKSSPAKEPKADEKTMKQEEDTEAKEALNEADQKQDESGAEAMDKKHDEGPSKVEAPAKMEETQETAVKQEETKAADAAETEEIVSKQEEEADDNSHVKADPLEADYEALREYKDAYEKVLDPTTGTFRYIILDQEHEEDYAAIKYGAGIGATHRSMSAKEKEAEFKRWQTSLLARIPEQPTFEELGMQNRVFLLEERRKRALEEEKVTTPKKKKAKSEDGGSSTKKEKARVETEDSDDDAMDIDKEEESKKDSDSEDDDENDEDYKEKAEKDSDEEKEDKDTPKKDDKENKEEGDKAEAGDEPPKILKPISLAAVPSFYDQDLKRVRSIHSDLMATSMHDHARRRLEEVTRDYNMALRTSNELYDRRTRIQNQLNAFVYENRGHLSKLKNEYRVELAIAKSRFKQRREEFDRKKLDGALPSRWGRAPEGTPMTKLYKTRNDQVSHLVSDCLADIVDSVDLASQGRIKLEKFEEKFVPPPIPDFQNAVDPKTGETLQHRNQRVENALRKELNVLSIKLRTSEDERQRAWKKMLKTKAEFDVPHQQGPRSRIQIDLSNYHLMPMPALRQSSTQSIPQEVAAARSSVASYVPVRSHPFPARAGGGSESKYSAARVRERIAADGTVAPVSEPKKTKDGLYQRPAGRTRKGMEWDSVRGIWVPEGSGFAQH